MDGDVEYILKNIWIQPQKIKNYMIYTMQDIEITIHNGDTVEYGLHN